MQQPADVERFSLHPGVESRCGQQIVERHGEREPIARWEECVDLHDPDAPHRRRLNQLDDLGKTEVPTFRPRRSEDRGQQDMFAALDGIGIDTSKGEQARRRRLNAVAE